VARRKFREAKSKFHGTKQVLQDINAPAHSILHDLDVSIAGGGASGYVLFWQSNTFMHQDDISSPIYVPEAGTITAVYCSLPLPAISPFEVDVYLNAVSIFPTLGTRPVVNTGDTYSADAAPDTPDVLARDALEVQIVDTGGNPGRAIVYIVVE
jgi:hypothetical protein